MCLMNVSVLVIVCFGQTTELCSSAEKPNVERLARQARLMLQKTNVRKPYQIIQKNRELHSQTICLFTHKKQLFSGFTNVLLKRCRCALSPKHLFFFVLDGVIDYRLQVVCVCLCHYVFLPAVNALLVETPLKATWKKNHSSIRLLTRFPTCW